ncbi:MAG TPA: nitrile hydratase subunit beta [Oxalicibacterium sp.]|jgi:nitrile hydratase beta subunit|nr:nitrile hydratase subunit beta [Oxalicibacterium sp.]
MKLQHYIGGLENLGPVNLDTRVFYTDWEKRIFGIHTVMMAESAHLGASLPRYPIDQVPTIFKETWTWASLRTGAEGMQPFEYFKYRYYEKWLMGISQFFIDRGYVAAEELAKLAERYRAEPDTPLPQRPNPALKEQVQRYLRHGDSGLRPLARTPRFKTGDTVYVADPLAADHSRLPGFLRNKRGVVTEVYPDAFEYFVSTGPDGLEGPQHVYCVSFDAADLWGAGKSEPNTVIYADLFDAYLKAPQ